MSPGAEADPQRKGGGAQKQQVAERIDRILVPEELGEIGERQNDERHGEPTERGVGSRREDADVGHLAHEQRCGGTAQSNGHVPGIRVQWGCIGQQRPVKTLPGQEHDVQGLQGEEGAVREEDPVGEHAPDEQRTQGKCPEGAKGKGDHACVRGVAGQGEIERG